MISSRRERININESNTVHQQYDIRINWKRGRSSLKLDHKIICEVFTPKLYTKPIQQFSVETGWSIADHFPRTHQPLWHTPRQRSLVARRLVRHARWHADPQISPRKRWSDKMRERKRGKIIGWWIISVGEGVTGGQSVFVSIQGSPGTLISVSFQYPSSTPPATYTSYKYLLKPHEARLRAYTCVSIQTRSFF